MLGYPINLFCLSFSFYRFHFVEHLCIGMLSWWSFEGKIFFLYFYFRFSIEYERGSANWQHLKLIKDSFCTKGWLLCVTPCSSGGFPWWLTMSLLDSFWWCHASRWGHVIGITKLSNPCEAWHPPPPQPPYLIYIRVSHLSLKENSGIF